MSDPYKLPSRPTDFGLSKSYIIISFKSDFWSSWRRLRETTRGLVLLELAESSKKLGAAAPSLEDELFLEFLL